MYALPLQKRFLPRGSDNTVTSAQALYGMRLSLVDVVKLTLLECSLYFLVVKLTIGMISIPPFAAWVE